MYLNCSFDDILKQKVLIYKYILKKYFTGDIVVVIPSAIPFKNSPKLITYIKYILFSNCLKFIINVKMLPNIAINEPKIKLLRFPTFFNKK